MSQVEKLTIYFVLPSDDTDENEISNDLKLAHNTVVKYGAHAKWLKPSVCLSLSPSSKDVFVFEKFEGKAFEELRKKSAKILGAQCMLTCLSGGRSIPNGVSPVFTEGMRDLVVCCTGFDSATKKELQEKVEFMGGIYVKSLRAVTTHLVALNNISSKAIEAYKSNLPIMRYEWVEAVWEKSKCSNVNGKDIEFNCFKSPLFHNLKITTSGIGKTEKDKIKDLIASNGGTFTGTLEDKATNILLVTKPEGDKFKYAKLWNIHCLKPSWLYKSVATKTIHPFNAYVVDSKNPKSSTPNKDDANFTANFSMMSVIAPDSDKLITHLEETGAVLSGTSVKTPFQTPKALLQPDSNCDIINNALLKNLNDAGQFLDGCNIYLCGFSAEDMEKLRKVLNVGGATRFNELTEFVSHIVVGKKTDNVLSQLKNSSAHILSINWLVESLKLKRPAPEENFLVLGRAPRSAEPPSPLSKLGAKLLTTAENKTFEKPQFCLEVENDQFAQMEIELLSKYKQSQPGEPLTQRQNQLTRSTNSSFQTRPTCTQPNDEVFKGLTFFLSSELIEEERKQIEVIIAERGGQVVGKRFLGVPDYAILPLCGASLLEITTKEVVNVFFLKDCCLEETIVSIQYYHQPVACVKESAPLKNCVISVSNYIQCEREFIESLIEILGARSQSLLARKPKENVEKSTHLVCSDPTGQKYNGAIRWGLPVVHHDWLLKCAALGIRVSEEPYLVGDSKLVPGVTSVTSEVQQKKIVSAETKSTSQPQSKTPAGFKNSPVHNAISRLKGSTSAANSPDANRTMTPTSPYGAFYGNENPSPGTRKRLWKWMHQGADFPVDPPTNYQPEPTRRDSTPLSTVLSKLLVEMKRKPEDIPKDSPVSRYEERSFEPEAPPKKLILEDAPENHSSLITTGLQKMKEIEENYAKNQPKPQTPVRKQSDSAPQMLVVTESQPLTEVGWEDPNEKEMALKKLEQIELSEKVFMLTCLPDPAEVAKLIQQCGGKVSSLPHFDKNATHLISKDLTRDEKLMGSIAAGLWVLHPSYIDELRTVRDVHKIAEEHYEWGNPKEVSRTCSLTVNTKAFASCSREWRLSIKAGEPKPFEGVKMILHLRMTKFENFKRLIEAGAGEIVNAKPPYSGDVDADVCVVEAGYAEGINFEELAKRDIPCVTILYISDRILKKPDAIDRNILQPFMKYWTKKP